MNPPSEHDVYLAHLARLHSRIDYERTTTAPDGLSGLKLERMRQLMARLGNPERQLRIVHVAGTKGKGSTSAMLGAILTQAGLRTGVYTSPHLERLEERFAIDRENCSPSELVRLIAEVWPAVDSLDRDSTALGFANGPTFFEITTAMAIVWFAQRHVDLAVLEVGLGGRLDSTNICDPLVAVITSISLDHTRQLGNTLEAIAWEKAGIVKPGRPVVSGVRGPGPRGVIYAVARERESPLYAIDERFSYELGLPNPDSLVEPSSSHRCGMFSFRDRLEGRDYELSDLTIGLLGAHQATNASIALATVNRLREQGIAISDLAIRQGLASVRCPARVEVVSRDPFVIVDTAHNVASVEALLRTLGDHFPTAKRRLLVYATSRDKDFATMLRLLSHEFQTIILTRFQSNPRALAPRDLLNVVPRQPGLVRPEYRVAETPEEAWRMAEALRDAHDLVCVTGSFFLAAEIRALLPRHTPSAKLNLESGV